MDFGTVLVHLVIVLVAARLAAEVAERAGFPAVLAEILAGIAIGPSALGLIRGDEFIRLLGELGVILLLFEVGRQMDLTELARVGGASLAVAGIGVAAPMAGGYAAMRAVGLDGRVSLFVAGAITATSVGLTARVFGDLRMLASTEARTVLGAAVADDVIGLLVLTVVVGYATGRDVSGASVALTALTAIGFIAAATLVGIWLVPRAMAAVSLRARTDAALMTIGLAFALGVARLASAARLAPIVGAFVAGIAVARSDARDELHRRIAPLGQVLIPIFFLQIGVETRLRVFAGARVMGIAALLCAVGVAGKLVAGLGISGRRADRLLVGLGMVPRGEVGLIFAGLGLTRGVLGPREYGALVFVVLLTSVVPPPLMRMRIRRARAREIATRTEMIEPEGGWLAVSEREVELRGPPPPGLAPLLGLRAARAAATRVPGQDLMRWLSASAGEQAAWDEPLRGELAALLREGNERSWRLLELTGLLGALLPDVDRALRRGAGAELELEPAGRWRFLAAVRARLPEARVGDPDAVLLAALARTAFEHERDPAGAAARLAASIGWGEERAALVSFLVAERHLLPAAARRLDMGTEEAVLDLAAHVGTIERARALHALAVAENAIEPWERERLDELAALVGEALEHPDLTGEPATTLVEQRREAARERLAHLPEAVRRHLDAAPRRYLLAQDPAAIERHLRMLETPLARAEARLHADPGAEQGLWTVHLAFQDRTGALAAIAGAFSAHAVDIEEAAVSTWRSGVCLDVFRVRASRDADWEAVRRAVEAAFSKGPSRDAVPIEGVVSVDNLASPWHTIVEVRARDRTGLLHRVASALSRAGLQIDHAAVTTQEGVAVDAFWVTGRNGAKLDAAGERALRDAFAGKPSGGWRAALAARRRRQDAARVTQT